jgi:hypothetical protein
MHRVADCVAGRVRAAIQKATEWQRIGNQIDAAFAFGLFYSFVVTSGRFRIAFGSSW